MTGRIDVHSHLLPGVDDGCKTVEDSLECAREMVKAGYTHSFCTPHVWPGFPNQTTVSIPQWCADLQKRFDAEGVALKLMPGGEINLREDTPDLAEERVVTYGMGNKFVLIDLWADVLPEFFKTSVGWLQKRGLTVVLAHPERMRAVQESPELADEFDQMGILLQGNLQCLADRPDTMTRRTGERYLRDGRYFMLGSDLHNPYTLGHRLQGLSNAIEWIGDEAVDQLTEENPGKLL
jgi:protein-tyrosine phosphatase